MFWAAVARHCGHLVHCVFWFVWASFSRCKCKQDFVVLRRILVVPRDSGIESTGFRWCILGDKGSRCWHSWPFCGKWYAWRTIEGLQLVMHTIVSHYENYWYIFCGKSMLKRVGNVKGIVPWRQLGACYSCFMLYNVYVCLHFATMCDNLHPTAISPCLLWNTSRFFIFSIHEAKSLHRILLVHYNGFSDSSLQRNNSRI